MDFEFAEILRRPAEAMPIDRRVAGAVDDVDHVPRLLLPFLQGLLEDGLIQRPQFLLFPLQNHRRKKVVADRKILETRLVGAAPNDEAAGLLNLETYRIVGLEGSPQKADDVEIEAEGPDRFLEIFHDQH